MTTNADLIAELRDWPEGVADVGDVLWTRCRKAAAAIESQAAEIARLQNLITAQGLRPRGIGEDDMSNITLIELGWAVAKLELSKSGSSLTIMIASDVSEHGYTPAQSVTIYGKHNMQALRDTLVKVLTP